MGALDFREVYAGVQNENGEDWNVDDPMQVEEFLTDLDTKDPYVLTVVPSSSVRQRIAACKAHWSQIRRKQFFLLELPADYGFWNTSQAKDLMKFSGVEVVDGPMCKWYLKEQWYL